MADGAELPAQEARVRGAVDETFATVKVIVGGWLSRGPSGSHAASR